VTFCKVCRQAQLTEEIKNDVKVYSCKNCKFLLKCDKSGSFESCWKNKQYNDALERIKEEPKNHIVYLIAANLADQLGKTEESSKFRTIAAEVKIANSESI